MVDKEKLIEKMREAALNKASFYQPDINMIDRVFDKYGTACAEAALKHMPQWVKVEDAKPDHRKDIWMMVVGYKYPIKGYYNKVIGVFHSTDNPLFNGYNDIVYRWQYEYTPEPPKE